MHKRTLLKKLYNIQLKDLNGLTDQINNFVLCPICLRKIHRDEIEQESTTDGHVWPISIRKGCDFKISGHRVLLCKSCNSNTGRAGDAQLQKLEKLKKENFHGHIEDRRNIKLSSHEDGSEIIVRASVITDADGNQSLKFHSKTIAPEILEQLHEGTKSNRHFAMVVPPPSDINDELARIGWLTSGYLFLFYVLGYSYILSSELEVVRRIILESFKNKEINFPKHEILRVHMKNDFYITIPELRLAIPINGIHPPFMQIRILDIEIDLPTPWHPQTVEQIRKQYSQLKKDIDTSNGGIVSIVLPIPVKGYDSGIYTFMDKILGRPIRAQIIV